MPESRTLDLATALIARPSVTPDDAGCLELIGARLAALGFALERIDVGGVCNLWARRGSTAPRGLPGRPHRRRADWPAGELDERPVPAKDSRTAFSSVAALRT